MNESDKQKRKEIVERYITLREELRQIRERLKPNLEELKKLGIKL